MSICRSPRPLILLAAALLLVACGESPKPPVESAGVVAPAPAPETEPASAPAGVVTKPEVVSMYEGKIVRRPPSTGGKEDGWFLVKDGKRRWISDGAWLEKNGYKASDVIEIPADDLQAIPEDGEAITP